MSKKVIELQNIKRDFKVGDEIVHALRGVSFTICEGEFVTIMGTSGSGKSTLLNTLGCLDTPTSGEYLLHREGRTIIFVTHNPGLSQYSSRTIRLRDGHVIEDILNPDILSAEKALAALPKNDED